MIFHYCNVCGQVVVLPKHDDKGISCCETPMTLLEPNTTLLADPNEHHIELRQIGYFITVSVPNHPVMDVHHIEFIAIETNQGFQLKTIENNQELIARFILAKDEVIEKVYAFCNIHLLLFSESSRV